MTLFPGRTTTINFDMEIENIGGEDIILDVNNHRWLKRVYGGLALTGLAAGAYYNYHALKDNDLYSQSNDKDPDLYNKILYNNQNAMISFGVAGLGWFANECLRLRGNPEFHIAYKQSGISIGLIGLKLMKLKASNKHFYGISLPVISGPGQYVGFTGINLSLFGNYPTSIFSIPSILLNPISKNLSGKLRPNSFNFIEKIDDYTGFDYYIEGISISGGTIVTQRFTGVAISGIFNGIIELNGISISGYTIHGMVNGIAISGGFTGDSGFISDRSRINGVAIGGIAVKGDINGLALAGLYNYMEYSKGVTLAPINITKGNIGLQIGLINYAESLRGIQIGLINIAGDAPIPILPLINMNF